MDLINRIRRENGCDQAMLRHVQNDPEIINTIKALQGNASRGLERLSVELYSKSTHFLLEFIQNADDNEYASNVIPTLHLKFKKDRIHISCNEIGFHAANVEAICKIGASTKKNHVGYIGEKGIGFKSVFKIADIVHISSGKYTFKLDRRQGELGMITPIWTPCLRVVPGYTTFDLELSKSADPVELSTDLKDIKPSLLLFLRRLRTVTIDGPIDHLGRNATVEIHRDNIDADVVHLHRVENGLPSSEKFFMVNRITKTYSEEKKRKNVMESEVVLAFPLTENEAPKVVAQAVHAFLPLRSFGFTFVIQADFLTSTSREDILSDLKWNITLRDAISDAFLSAVAKFRLRPSLQFIWFRFLPKHITSPFFSPVESAIISELSKRPIFRSAGQQYHKPSKFIIASTPYCAADGTPLIPEAHLPGGLHYLSLPYDVNMDGHHFRRLGVKDMSDEHFLGGLKSMGSRIQRESTAWHEAVCRRLYEIHKPEILQLSILPLSDGSWVAGNLSSNIFFNSKLAGIPQDLGLHFLKPDIPLSSWRHILFEKFGVREANSQHVGCKILELHRGQLQLTSIESLITHASFMFVHHSPGFPSATGLRVVDEYGSMADGEELYADIQDKRQSIRMRGILPPPARFLHPDYLRVHSGERMEEWQTWLRDSLGVNVFPRLIRGELSPEFEALARAVSSTIDTCQFLTILKETWSYWSARLYTTAISRLSKMDVICENGSKENLTGTYLKRRPLTNYSGLPFLPVDNPEHRDWDFLSELGVTHKVDGVFFIKNLVRLKEENSNDESIIQETYEQIQARFDDDAEGIRNMFQKNSLIYCKPMEQWIAISDTVWNGPPSMTSKVSVKTLFPSLQKLFHTQLKIPTASPVILASELEALAVQWKGQTIPETVVERVSAILVDIGDTLSDDPSALSPGLLHKLSSKGIFPVQCPSNGSILRAPDEDFYVPEPSGFFLEKFRSQVPFLSLSESTSLRRVQPFLQSDALKSRLKFLETSVRSVSIAEEPWQLDRTASEKYATRVHFIERLVRSGPQSKWTTQIQNLLVKLQKICVYTVPSILTTYILEPIKHTAPDDVLLNQTATEIVVLTSKAPSQCDIPICNKLAMLLHVDVNALFILVTQSPEVVEQLFQAKGIPKAIDDNSVDRSWFQSDDAKNDSSLHVRAAALSRSQEGRTSGTIKRSITPPSIAVDSQCNVDPQQLQDCLDSVTVAASRIHTNLDNAVAAQSTGLIASPPSVFARALSPANEEPSISTGSFLARSQSSGHQPAALHSGAGNNHMKVTPYQLINGIAGEYFIYTLFSKKLPNFGPNNWTSELRGEAKGFKPYMAASIADFTYRDDQGAMTCLIYSQAQKEAWKDCWPTYYLEVKSTSGESHESFFMSRNQLATAMRLTRVDSTSPPKAIYVIIRVSGVRSQTIAWTTYPDPHHLFYTGRFLNVSRDGAEVKVAN